MTPPKYAYAAAKRLLEKGGRMETGWSVGTLAEIEPQKAILLLRRAGVRVVSKRLSRSTWAYSIHRYEDWFLCKQIVREWEKAYALVA